jgi:hypothetical protein
LARSLAALIARANFSFSHPVDQLTTCLTTDSKGDSRSSVLNQPDGESQRLSKRDRSPTARGSLMKRCGNKTQLPFSRDCKNSNKSLRDRKYPMTPCLVQQQKRGQCSYLVHDLTIRLREMTVGGALSVLGGCEIKVSSEVAHKVAPMVVAYLRHDLLNAQYTGR